MKLSILDMGKEQYGDCLYLENGGVKVLIDGGHPGDFDGQPPDTKPIPAQLAQVSNIAASKPIEVDLLIVTHSHSDHIGCLPKMIQTGKLKAKFALVSDPDHRWGTASAPPDAPPALQKALDLLHEEIPPLDQFKSREELREFLDARANQEQQYRGMLDALKSAGTTVIRYGTDPISKPLKSVMTKAGLMILGPTRAHLKICQDALASSISDARDAAMRDGALPADARNDYVELYLRLARGSGEMDSARDAVSDKFKGAINDLSIVILLKFGALKVLLPGDMQFALPQVVGLEQSAATLLKKVAAAGPYQAIKMPHHTSDNGWNLVLHNTTLPTPLLIHSGGSKDSDHPDANTLKMLKANATGHTYLRTDRNGLIEIQPDGKKLKFKFAKGTANDFTPNLATDGGLLKPRSQVAAVTTSTVSSLGESGDVVRVHAEIPNRHSRVTITVEIDPGAPVPLPSHFGDEKKK